MPKSDADEPTYVIADRAYTCNEDLSEEKKVVLVNTNLTVKDALDNNADFEFN